MASCSLLPLRAFQSKHPMVFGHLLWWRRTELKYTEKMPKSTSPSVWNEVEVWHRVVPCFSAQSTQSFTIAWRHLTFGIWKNCSSVEQKCRMALASCVHWLRFPFPKNGQSLESARIVANKECQMKTLQLCIFFLPRLSLNILFQEDSLFEIEKVQKGLSIYTGISWSNVVCECSLFVQSSF